WKRPGILYRTTILPISLFYGSYIFVLSGCFTGRIIVPNKVTFY
ncbi:MAG: hypothetical protein AVDCRST_MAG95-151, partial [uncultured Adhaeribacter sp.]